MTRKISKKIKKNSPLNNGEFFFTIGCVGKLIKYTSFLSRIITKKKCNVNGRGEFSNDLFPDIIIFYGGLII